MNQFKETFNRFKPALTGLDYSTYWEWMLIPDDLKSAALYVQFYDTITLAWSKTQKPFIEEEIAVSTVMQYLIKNVEIIGQHRKRFTPEYMYKIAFNALYPLGRIKRDIDYYYNEHASEYEKVKNRSDDMSEEFDPDNSAYTERVFTDRLITSDVYFDDTHDDDIWCVIESCDDDTKRIIEYLLGGKKLGKKLSAKVPDVVADLRIKLEKYNTLA